jgi:hypothetical protein
MRDRRRATCDHVISVRAHDNVVAGAAGQHIGASAAVEDIVAAVAEEPVVAAEPAHDVGRVIADDDVGEAVAGAGDGSRAGERQVLDVAAEREGGGGEHAVDAGAGALDGAVAGAVDEIRVVAGAADHDVVAEAAVEAVVAGAPVEAVVAAEPAQGVRGVVAENDVGEAVAGAAYGARAGQRQVLDVAAEGVGDRGEHAVDAGAAALDGAVAAWSTM